MWTASRWAASTRGGATKAFIAKMGTPDEQSSETMCGEMPLKHTVYRWGDLRVVVLDELDAQNEYADTFPVGEVAGWLIDPTLDGDPALSFAMVGPEGTAIGTPLATLEQRFTTDEWDHAERDENRFGIFAGDTTGAVFDLGPDDTVTAMSAGYSCIPRG